MDPLDIEPVDRGEFATCITPCLSLVAPVGMDGDSQDAWLESAFIALEGIPITLLKRGAKVAMQTADHPSKIVPTIMKAIGEDWESRKRWAPLAGQRRIASPPAPPPAPVPEISAAEREEVKGLISDLAQSMKRHVRGIE